MLKKILIGGVVIAVTIFLLITVNNKWKSSVSQTAETENATLRESKINVKASILVSPQSDSDTVQVERVTLTKGGFLAVRAVDSNRLGQIIEISEYLAAGTHSNLSITLGEFYAGSEELIVMIYEDAGSDQIFNDLDQPYEKNGVLVAVYVATGDEVSESIATNISTPEGISLMDMGTMQFISYTDDGFEPKRVTISLGTMVHFVNESSIDMWVASDAHPAHTDLPTFDQFKGSPPGEQYVYIFDQSGEWKYHDHLTPTAVGTIIVTN
jgi:plastocyanin